MPKRALSSVVAFEILHFTLSLGAKPPRIKPTQSSKNEIECVSHFRNKERFVFFFRRSHEIDFVCHACLRDVRCYYVISLLFLSFNLITSAHILIAFAFKTLETHTHTHTNRHLHQGTQSLRDSDVSREKICMNE